MSTAIARGALIRNHRVFLSVGHDEYWSGGQRANVEAARNAGVHLAFFSGNEVFWKTRWENSIDGSSTPYRTLVTYKETHANAKIDPTAGVDRHLARPALQPAGRRRPARERADRHASSWSTTAATTSIVVPAADGKMRFWRNTSVASLAPASTATLPDGTLGYEWDVDARQRLSSAGAHPPVDDDGHDGRRAAGLRLDLRHRHRDALLTLYRARQRRAASSAPARSSGRGASTRRTTVAGAPTDARMQQATVNLFADMGVQPATLRPGLVAATRVDR